MFRIFRAYNKVLNQFPFVTQCVTSGTLMAIGDTLSQRFVELKKKQNYTRTVQFGLMGLCFTGPLIRTWYMILERQFGPKTVGIVPLKKIVADQILFSPMLIGTNIVILGVMKKQTSDEIVETFKEKYIPILLNCYKLWPMAQCVTFYLIPLNYRVPFVSLVGLLWNIYYAFSLGHE